MIDKAILRTNLKLDKSEVLERMNGFHHEFLRGDSNYKTTIRLFRSEDEVFVVKLDPYFSNVRNLRIELNPALWGSYQKICDSLGYLESPEKLEVARIDHAVDINVPVGLLHKCLRVKYKRGWKNYFVEEGSGRDLNGFYIGKEPELFNIYNKKSQMRLKGLELPIKGELSRVELRQKKKKVPVEYLSDFPKLLEYNPFSKLEYYDFQNFDTGYKEQVLSLCLENSGFAQAYAHLNASNNFKRNYKKNIMTNDFVERLTSMYWGNLGHFYTP